MKLTNLVTTLCLTFFSLTVAREIPGYEKVEKLLGQDITPLNEIRQMHNQGKYDSFKLTQPWTGYYWANLNGSVGFRYRDPVMLEMSKKHKQKFSVMESYVWEESRVRHPLTLIRQNKINQLSPAEKYDFLIGDYNFTLTHSVWNWGRDAFRVKDWRGICDGWSQASFLFPRPAQTKTLTSVSGVPVNFYPEDIKGLLSLYMAESKPGVKLIGKRCRSKIFKNGKKCVGLNPAVLHSLMINQIARKGKPVIFDMDPTPEVWNYAIHSYSMKFYNPQTYDPAKENFAQSFKQSVVSLNKIKKQDPYSKLLKNRSKNASFIMGVQLTVDYADDDNPSLATTDSEANDVINTKIIRYDLELDHKLNLVGGEYHSSLRPDFAWVPKIEDGQALLENKRISRFETLTSRGGFNRTIKEMSEKSIPAPSILQQLINN